ncbi:MAG: DUF3990 domain-containing protein [Lachnospiraceae bacterium]|nr:DUF3990 domain-containing protein [Lachnospiraceae bacterium]
MKDLFHGTTYDINEIEVTMGKGYKDFGKGFYATSVKIHAENIARRNKRILEAREAKIRQRNPKYRTKTFHAYRYNLEFDDRCIDNPENLKIKVFKEANREWVRFILMNRDSDNSVHDYDIVIGPTADENTVTVINSYKEELIAANYSDELLDALIKELEPENLPKQYFFGTSAAIQKLQFKKIRREIVG